MYNYTKKGRLRVLRSLPFSCWTLFKVFCLEYYGAVAQAAGGGQSRDEGREGSYNHLCYQLNYSLFIHNVSRI